NRAELYRYSEQRDQALAIYQTLAEKRPHLMQVKRTMAQIYTEAGDFKKATRIYEELMKANPTAYQQLQWDLRWVYQRMGKGKELSKMEENMAAKATDPNQLSQLAWRFKEDGELDKAIELWRKADKMGTGYPWVKSQLAAALRSEEHTSELQSRSDLVCRLLLE